MYEQLIKPLLFRMQPETAHDVMRMFCRVANVPLISRALNSHYGVIDERLRVNIAGLSFSNPIGLAAGFDKNVELVGLWTGLGFGHLELGTVTAQPQPGNPRPRIFRLEQDRALINRMGFPSIGAEAIAERLRRLAARSVDMPRIGINIGKSKNAELDSAVSDYSHSFAKVIPYVDYVTVNVSSPNTPGLRQLQERSKLVELLKALQELNRLRKPIFVKLAPDLSFEAIREVVECCFETAVAGVIATNTTIGRDRIQTSTSEVGGLSGRPLFPRALEVVRCIGELVAGRMAVIGVGGISTPDDVLAMVAGGADMVQVYTGLIYEGPCFVKSLNLGLLSFMNTHGCQNLKEAAAVWQQLHSKGRSNCVVV